jgi:hypothetical protein
VDPSNSAPAVVVKLIRGENEKKGKETLRRGGSTTHILVCRGKHWPVGLMAIEAQSGARNQKVEVLVQSVEMTEPAQGKSIWPERPSAFGLQ